MALTTEVTGADGVVMDAFLGDQFTLLTRTGAREVDSEPLIQVVQVMPPDAEPSDSGTAQLLDAEGTITRWLDDVKADAVLLRPDRVPFGIYRDGDATVSKIAADLHRHLSG